MSKLEIKIKKLSENAVIPTRATKGSAGYDLYACIESEINLEPNKTIPVPTGIAVSLSCADYAAFIYARSGLAIKNGLAPANCVGVIDSDYRGEILVGLHNHSEKTYTIKPGERIAQMIIAPVLEVDFAPVDELDDTVRNAGGFGSTGS